jgi:hypothetical protein
LANIDLSAFPSADVSIRGRKEKMKIHLIERARDLPLDNGATPKPPDPDPEPDPEPKLSEDELISRV